MRQASIIIALRPKWAMFPRACKALVRARAPRRLDARPWPTDPHALFEEWFAEARAAEPNDAEAMALATADADGAAVGADGAAQGP